jgi:hypothetical protein
VIPAGVDAINIEQYKIILKKVWATQNADPEQLERLKLLRTTLNISEELHKKLEAEVRRDFLSSNNPTKVAPSDVNIMINESSVTKPKKQSSKPAHLKSEVPMPKSKTMLTAKTSKAPSSSGKLQKVKIKKYLTLAKQKYQKKNYKGSLKLLREGLKLDPKNEELKFYIKKVKLKQKSAVGDIEPKDNNVNELSAEVEDTNMGVIEKIAPSRAEQKRVGSKSAIPVGNLNGAPIIPETIGPNLNEKPDTIADPTETDTQVTSKIVTLNKPEKPKCISCNGTGSCYWCNGAGKCDRCAGTGIYNDETCTICNGSGKCNSCIGEGTCMWCRGKGIGKQMNTIYSNEE